MPTKIHQVSTRPSKEKLAKLIAEGLHPKTIGIRFGVHYNTVKKWLLEDEIEWKRRRNYDGLI